MKPGIYFGLFNFSDFLNTGRATGFLRKNCFTTTSYISLTTSSLNFLNPLKPALALS
jgi:hypothetical protein